MPSPFETMGGGGSISTAVVRVLSRTPETTADVDAAAG